MKRRIEGEKKTANLDSQGGNKRVSGLDLLLA